MRTDWQTPLALFKALDAFVGGFKVDAAADRGNSLCERYYGPGSEDGEDALALDVWHTPAFCNPPYNQLEKWTAKFADLSAQGTTILALLPASVGTRWWYDNVVIVPADIVFLTGRVQFELPEGDNQEPSQNRHDSAIVIYAPDSSLRVSWWDWKTILRGPSA